MSDHETLDNRQPYDVFYDEDDAVLTSGSLPDLSDAPVQSILERVFSCRSFRGTAARCAASHFLVTHASITQRLVVDDSV